MGSLNIFSTLMQLLWPILSVATFVICLQIQGRHKGTDGVFLLVAGAAMVMFMSLTNVFFQAMINSGGLDFMSISSYFSITSALNLVGQVIFVIGL